MSDSSSWICDEHPFTRPMDHRAFWFEHAIPSALPLISRVFLALALFVAFPALDQSQSLSDPGQSSNRGNQRTSPADVTIAGQQALQQHKLLAQLNAERQKSMVSDAAKLLRLAQELNTDLTRGDSAMSPAQRAHKAAEIEKLAHNVREKMSFAVGMTLGVESPFNASVP